MRFYFERKWIKNSILKKINNEDQSFSREDCFVNLNHLVDSDIREKEKEEKRGIINGNVLKCEAGSEMIWLNLILVATETKIQLTEGLFLSI